jgi:hypothetical protein
MIARSNSAKYAEHLEESPSGRGGCVNRLLFEIEIAANGVQFAKKADEILQRSAKPIDRPRGNDIDLAAHDLFQKPIERWPSVTAFRAADALVGKFGGDNPSRPTTDCFGERSTLVVDGLPIFRRDPKVELGGEETCPSRPAIPKEISVWGFYGDLRTRSLPSAAPRWRPLPTAPSAIN